VTTVFQRVGPYEIVREIGRGGMAAVFLADDTRVSRQVALKLVPIGYDREAREILEAERLGANLQERLADSCGMAPRVFEQGEQPPYYFIAMEYIDGENLSDLISRGPVEPSEATRIACALSRFLDTAHSFKTTIDGREGVSLVHGDLKPRNVRLSQAGEIKVLDFGIAKALSLSRKVTRNDFGSMPYLSPERLDSAEVDAHADLWALGVILYELVSGTPPFRAADTRRLEQDIRGGYEAHPLPGTCPPGLQAITARLLAASLSDRYESASAVLSDLEVFGSGGQPQAQVQGFPRLVDEQATRRTTPPAAGVDPDATRRTQKPVQPVAAAAAVAAVASVASTTRTAAAPVIAPALPPSPMAAPPLVAAPPLPVTIRRPSLARRATRFPLLRTALLLIAFMLVTNEMSVAFQAKRTGARARTLDLEGMSALWPEYDRLSRKSSLRMGVMNLERILTERVETLTDQVISNYRSTLPTVRERQWRSAQENLRRALVLEPDNSRLKAAFYYCEGHLHRIDGEAEKLRQRTAVATRHFTEAVRAFREAADVRRDWPDPFLGLARTFIYGLEDIDQAADAFKRAQSLGYTTGDRETVQLADGYRARGDSLWRTARQLRDLPQELEYLRRASESYRQANDLYEKIPAFAGVAGNLRRTHTALDRIAERVVERANQDAEDQSESPWP
jgi:tetratricopeptide (TPR) repeat protein